VNLHLSLVFSFNLKNGYDEKWLIERLIKVRFRPIAAKLTIPGLFEQQGKQILYLTVEPYDELMDLHRRINKTIGKGTEIETTGFDGGELPDFWPHITLDYDFDGDRYTFAGLEREGVMVYFEIERLTIVRMRLGGMEKVEQTQS
jgi:2'-5' RNA ligase